MRQPAAESPIDFRAFVREGGADVAVESLDVPGVVDRREPFQFTASIRADRTADAEIVLFRDEVEISRGKHTLAAGSTPFTFRDLLERPGLARYRIEVATAQDPVPQNNIGNGAVRVEAPASILLVNSTGAADNLSRALAAGGIPVTIVPADQRAALACGPAGVSRRHPRERAHPAARAAGARCARAVRDRPRRRTARHWRTRHRSALAATSSPSSIGHLPVSMEIRNEHRKLSLAMAVALDRSGSMAVPAGDGRTKMDLANLGTCAAIETLGPFDEVGVIAVDSAAHVVQPLTAADNKEGVCDQVRTIQSMGGGIFTYTALLTAAEMVQESRKGTRHIVLFADAADAEEPGDYVRLLEKLRSIGITVSVIGLGTETRRRCRVPEGRGLARRRAHDLHVERGRTAAAVRAGGDHRRAFELRDRADERENACRHDSARRAASVGVPAGGRLQPHLSASRGDAWRRDDRRVQRAGAGVLAPRPRARGSAHGGSRREVLGAAERLVRFPVVQHRAGAVAARGRPADRRPGHDRATGIAGHRPRRARPRSSAGRVRRHDSRADRGDRAARQRRQRNPSGCRCRG